MIIYTLLQAVIVNMIDIVTDKSFGVIANGALALFDSEDAFPMLMSIIYNS